MGKYHMVFGTASELWFANAAALCSPLGTDDLSLSVGEPNSVDEALTVAVHLLPRGSETDHHLLGHKK